MLLTGLGALAALIMVAGYPAGAVGVTGETRSHHLGPPSLLVLALAAVQLGLFVLVRPRRAAGPPGRILAVLNAVALPVFLWHQSALLLLVIAAAELLPVEVWSAYRTVRRGCCCGWRGSWCWPSFCTASSA